MSPAGLRSNIAATEALNLRARGWHTGGRTEYSAQTFSDPPYAAVSQDFENSVYSFEGEYRREDGFGVRATLSRAIDDIEQLQPGFGPTEFDYARTAPHNVEVQVDLAQIGTHAVSFGLQRSDENTRAQSFGTVFDEDTMVTQAFVQDQFDIGRLNSRLALGGVDHETFGSEVTWNAEFGAAFGKGTRLTLSGGKAFRAPDSTDRFGFGGNPDLEPEVSGQVELSVRQKFGDDSSCRCPRSTTGSTISSSTWSSTSTRSTAGTRTSNARASRAWSLDISSRAKAGARAPRSRCRIRAMRPATRDCCAARANR